MTTPGLTTSLEQTARSVAALVAALVVRAACGWLRAEHGSVLVWILHQTLPIATLLAGVVLLRRRWRNPRAASAGAAHRAGRRATALVASGAWALGLAAPTWLRLGTSPADLAPALAGLPQLVWAFAWVCIVAPMAEELYFRGVLQTALTPAVGAALAVTATALAFAVSHPSSAAWREVFVLGLVFGALYATTGRLAAPAAAHIGWNAGSVLASFGHGLPDCHAVACLGALLVAAGAAMCVLGGRRARAAA